MRAGLVSIGFADWRPTLYAFLFWGVALGDQPGSRARRGSDSRRLFVLPALLFTAAMVIFPTLFGLYIAFTDWNLNAQSRPPFQRPRQSADAVGRSLFLERARQHGLLCADRPRSIRDRLRPRAAAQRRHPRPQVLPRRLPAALHAEPRRGQLDDRQVDHGEPLRAARDFRAMARLGESGLLHLAVDRPHQHHRHGRWVWIPFMVILLLAGLAGAAARGEGGGQGRRRQPLADLLGDHLSADAAGQRDRDRAADHLRTEARRHRHQRHRGRARAARPTRFRASSIANIATARMSAMRRWSPRSISSSSSSSSRCC